METPVTLPSFAAPEARLLTPGVPPQPEIRPAAPQPQENSAALPLQEAAPANPLMRAAKKLGALARNAYEKTQVTLGMAMAGAHPESAPDTEPKPPANGRLAATANRLGNANFLRAATLGVGLGAVAVAALAKHHGAGTGAEGLQALQPVGDITPIAVPEVEHQGLLLGSLIAGGLAITSWLPLLAWKDRRAKMRLHRAESQRLTQPQPIYDKDGNVIRYDPPALDVIRYRAEDAEERRRQAATQRNIGLPLHLDMPTQAYNQARGIPTHPPGFSKNKLLYYHPLDSNAQIPTPPPASDKLRAYRKGRRHFDY